MSDSDHTCMGCGELEGSTHKPGCSRYTSSPIVQEKDVHHVPGPAIPSPVGKPVTVGKLPTAPDRERRTFTLMQPEQVDDLLCRAVTRHPDYTVTEMVNDLLREGDNPVPIAAEPRRSALDVVGWVDQLDLTPEGEIEAHVYTADDTMWDVLEAGAGLSASVTFDYVIKSDGQKRPVFLTEVVIQPPVPQIAEAEPVKQAGWRVDTFSLANDAPVYGQQAELDQGQAIQNFLNRAPHTYTFKQAVTGARGSVHVIGYSYDPENSF